jgi:hypothetical protein
LDVYVIPLDECGVVLGIPYMYTRDENSRGESNITTLSRMGSASSSFHINMKLISLQSVLLNPIN